MRETRLNEAALLQHAEMLLHDVAEKPERLADALLLLHQFARRQSEETDPAVGEREVHRFTMFMGLPDRWHENPTWKCSEGHVADRVLKSEEKGALCLTCQEPVRLVDPDTHENIDEWLANRGMRKCPRCSGIDGDVRGQTEGWRLICNVVRELGFDEWEFSRSDRYCMIDAVPAFLRELARREASAQEEAGLTRKRLRQAAAWFREYEVIHEHKAAAAKAGIVIHSEVTDHEAKAARNRERAEYCEGGEAVPLGA